MGESLTHPRYQSKASIGFDAVTVTYLATRDFGKPLIWGSTLTRVLPMNSCIGPIQMELFFVFNWVLKLWTLGLIPGLVDLLGRISNRCDLSTGYLCLIKRIMKDYGVW